MKPLNRYIGNHLIAFVAIIFVLLLLLPIVVAIVALSSQFTVSTVFILLMCTMMIAILIIYAQKVSLFSQLYTWCLFDENGVTVITLFAQKYKIFYNQCKDVGVISYAHGILNSDIGSKQSYIYLSYVMIPDNYREAANYLLPTKTTIKISYNKDTFEYLCKVLPQKQKNMLLNNRIPKQQNNH